MGHWRSLISGEKIDYVPSRSIEDLVARRNAGASIFTRLNVDLPDVAAHHEKVVMRPHGRSTPTAEIYVPHGLYGPEDMSITLRTHEGAPPVLPAARALLRRSSADVPMYRVETVEEAVKRQVAP